MDYVVDGRLGRASKFGGLLTAHTASGERLTVKKLEKYSAELPEVISRLQDVDCPELPRVREVTVGNDGCLYIVKDYIEGTDLKSIMTNKEVYGKIEEMQYVRMAIGVLKALEKVHALGILHRNVKPSNIILRHKDGENLTECDFSNVTLIDFERASSLTNRATARSTFNLIYSPPEMILKHNDLADQSSDLFSLALSLYHLVMGKSPFTDCNPEVLINLQLTYAIRRPSRMTEELFNVINKAALKEPFRLSPRKLSNEEIHETLKRGIERRYASASEMRLDLEQVTTALRPMNWIEKLIS